MAESPFLPQLTKIAPRITLLIKKLVKFVSRTDYNFKNSRNRQINYCLEVSTKILES